MLADLALEAEAATLLALRLARAFDRQDEDERERAAARASLTPVAKYWLCKRLPVFVGRGDGVLGGNGYVEERPLARLYREAPLNGIWEGSGNVICLDVLRAMQKTPDAREALRRSPRSATSAGARTMPAPLAEILAPRSIAIVGASDNPDKAGSRPVFFLKRFGFAGAIYPINPQRAEVQGFRASRASPRSRKCPTSR